VLAELRKDVEEIRIAVPGHFDSKPCWSSNTQLGDALRLRSRSFPTPADHWRSSIYIHTSPDCRLRSLKIETTTGL